jgi:Holliday junction resolvase RusA-like endonuclease
MTTQLIFNVPWAALCSDNRKFKFRFHLSDKYRNSKKLIGQMSLAAAKKNGWPLAVVDLGLYVLVREPDRRRRDFNWSKNLKDGITEGGGVWEDDSQVREERWKFDAPSKKNAGATIHIYVLEEGETRHEHPPSAVRTRPAKNGRNRRAD